MIDYFKIFDRDGSGLISTSELRHLTTNLGDKIKDEDFDEILELTGMTTDMIKYEDFVRIMIERDIN